MYRSQVETDSSNGPNTKHDSAYGQVLRFVYEVQEFSFINEINKAFFVLFHIYPINLGLMLLGKKAFFFWPNSKSKLESEQHENLSFFNSLTMLHLKGYKISLLTGNIRWTWIRELGYSFPIWIRRWLWASLRSKRGDGWWWIFARHIWIWHWPVFWK